MIPGSSSADDEPAWVGEVIRFWFEELPEDRWFAKSEATDAQIRARFLALCEQLTAHDGRGVSGPRSTLACVIVLDQFSRNLYRNSARAFAADSIARRLARAAIARGFDMAMKKEERYFLYLPFEHSEDRDDQALALRLIRPLGREDWTADVMAHNATIDRFGRFPHRNAALNRTCTEEERAALEAGILK